MEANEPTNIFEREGSEALPNGLQLLAMEFELYKLEDRGGWELVHSYDGTVEVISDRLNTYFLHRIDYTYH